MKITYHEPTPELLASVAARMCQDDRDELQATSGHSPEVALRESVAHSHVAKVACWDGEPHAVFGLAPYQYDDTLGVPWLLGTDGIRSNTREFLADSRRWIADWAPHYAALFNLVHADHVRAQRWLMWLGFDPIKHHNINGHSFIEFARVTSIKE